MKMILYLLAFYLFVSSCCCSDSSSNDVRDGGTQFTVIDREREIEDTPNYSRVEGTGVCGQPTLVISPVLFAGYTYMEDPMQPRYNSCVEAGLTNIELQIFHEDGTLLQQGSFECDEDGVVIEMESGKYLIGARADISSGSEVLTRGWIGQYCQEMNDCIDPLDPSSPFCDPLCVRVNECGTTWVGLKLLCNPAESSTSDICGF